MTTDEKPQRRLSLRILLLLIFAAALSPVLVIGGIRWSGDIEREVQYRRETMTLVARVAASRAENALATAPGLLELIATSVKGDPCDANLSSIVAALPDFSSLAAVDADGRVACASLEGAKGISVASRPWFAELRDTGATSVQSTALVGATTGKWTIASAKRRVKKDGSFDGALVLGTPINTLVAQLENPNLPEGYEVALLDSSGQVFASTNWDIMDSKVMSGLKPGMSGFFDVQSKTNEGRQAAIVPLTGNKFYAVVSAPPPPPLTLENFNAFGNFALPLMAWLLALVTAWLAMDRLVLRWLDYLRRIAGLYASGKLSVQPIRAKRQAPVEINVLADTMEEMAVRIRDRTNNMEEALAARDAAMKEIHHRVKNNLQIINSLLSLQGRKLKDRAAAAALDDARARINALSLIHSSLYEHNNINMVDTRTFFAELGSNLGQALGAEDLGIDIQTDIDNDAIDADLAVPLALFTAEAVTLAVKHAFSDQSAPSGRSRIKIVYNHNENGSVLAVEDNGDGVRPLDHGVGIGATLMSAFARQVRGTLEEGAAIEGGRYVRINIPPRIEKTVNKTMVGAFQY
ncbi:MAG: histidine kinase dimerization/phosphoacceptor domain -containing protein [Hyphomonadaceae bacterium]